MKRWRYSPLKSRFLTDSTSKPPTTRFLLLIPDNIEPSQIPKTIKGVFYNCLLLKYHVGVCLLFAISILSLRAFLLLFFSSKAPVSSSNKWSISVVGPVTHRSTPAVCFAVYICPRFSFKSGFRSADGFVEMFILFCLCNERDNNNIKDPFSPFVSQDNEMQGK